eukprot:2546991-Pyramimonas_sp.AAC.1
MEVQMRVYRGVSGMYPVGCGAWSHLDTRTSAPAMAASPTKGTGSRSHTTSTSLSSMSYLPRMSSTSQKH